MFAPLGRQQGLRLPGRQRQLAQQLRRIALLQPVQERMHRRLRIARHGRIQLAGQQRLALRQVLEQGAGFLQYPAQFLAPERIQPVDVLLDAVVENLAGDLVGDYILLRVVDRQAVFLREALRGKRVQAGGVEGGRVDAGHRCRCGGLATAEGMAGEFEVQTTSLQLVSKLHRAVVIVRLQANRLREIIGQEILTSGFA
ncbi:hypothetical protein [Xanthomonas translucens]|uniref:hypothetical protein n=1 Tax=Xanthomonas campestris pv. translucens TaxID=343 RepID=UPI0012D8F13A|nr:hypothetical protein [Xanthomonas translucens]